MHCMVRETLDSEAVCKGLHIDQGPVAGLIHVNLEEMSRTDSHQVVGTEDKTISDFTVLVTTKHASSNDLTGILVKALEWDPCHCSPNFAGYNV